MYVDEWISKQKLTTSTALCLKVTKHTALELIQYLSEKVGYKYLMTRRINQDVLEAYNKFEMFYEKNVQVIIIPECKLFIYLVWTLIIIIILYCP
jgi:hypothetical protein